MSSGAQDAVQAPTVPPTVPADNRVTLMRALDIAARQNPQRLASAHTVESARQNLRGQRSMINPTISFSGINNTVAPLNFLDSRNYAIYQTIETSGRQVIRTRTARAQLEGAVAESMTTRIAVQQAVIGAYVSLQTANLNLQSEQQAFADAGRISELTAEQFKLGAAPETNAINARIALEQEANNLRAAGTAVELARASLNLAMGLDPAAPVDAAEPLEFKPIAPRLADLEEQALRSRPEIQSTEAAERVLEAAVKQQRSQYYPDLVLGGTARFDELFLGAAMPIVDFGAIRGAVRKAREDVEAQRAQVEQTRQQVRLDVVTAWLALNQTAAQVIRSRDQIVPQAQILFARVEQGYRLGGNTILDLLNAQATLRSVRNDYNTALGSYRQAVAQLERATGGRAPD